MIRTIPMTMTVYDNMSMTTMTTMTKTMSSFIRVIFVISSIIVEKLQLLVSCLIYLAVMSRKQQKVVVLRLALVLEKYSS